MVAGTLASPLSSFIGRRSELAELERIGRSERLLTLVGPGGIGKTRLAAELSARAARRGTTVGIAELAPIEEHARIGQAVAAAFGVVGDEAVLSAWLGERRAVLVLDNCEHLRGAVAPLAARLLAAVPGLRIMATSREPLGLATERVWQVPPLSLPADELGSDWRRSEAVRLCVDRARAVAPRFAADATAATLIVQLCRRLDGLPLAIELAAKTLTSVALDDLVRGLAVPLDLLGRGAAKTGRHDTIRNAIAWSHALLDDRERRVFRCLAVFAGSFAIDSAERVCVDADVRREDVLPLVAGLAERSLVELVQADRGRYRLLEVIRQFALERLRESAEVDLVEQRRAHHVAELFDAYEPTSNARPTDALARIITEHQNVRASMSWGLAHDIGIARRIAAKAWLAYVFPRPGIDPVEIEGWIVGTLEADPAPDGARARMLVALSQRRFAAKDLVSSRRHAEHALALARAVGDHHAAGGAHHRLAMSAQAAGDVDGALAHFTAAVDEYGAAGVASAQAWALGMRAAARCLGGDDEGARADFAAAVALSDASPHIRRPRAIVLTLEGEHHARHNGIDDARRCFEEAVKIHQELGSEVPLARALHGLADVTARRGQPERAVRLAGAAAAIASWSGETWPGAGPTPSLEKAARELGSRAEATRDEGRRSTVDQAVALALGAATTGPTLSRREREIAGLVAEGLTSREIAARLGISERTAENHVEHMLVKLGVRSRVQIARWAAEHDLLAT